MRLVGLVEMEGVKVLECLVLVVLHLLYFIYFNLTELCYVIFY